MEIKDPKNVAFAAQVFAEMLGMANHPEYFRHEDQEVPPHFSRNFPISLRRLQCSSSTRHFSYIIANFPRIISKTSTRRDSQTPRSNLNVPPCTISVSPKNVVDGAIFSLRWWSTSAVGNPKFSGWVNLIRRIWFTRFRPWSFVIDYRIAKGNMRLRFWKMWIWWLRVGSRRLALVVCGWTILRMWRNDRLRSPNKRTRMEVEM